MLFTLVLPFGLMTLTLYSASLRDAKVEPLARILAMGTVIGIGLQHGLT